LEQSCRGGRSSDQQIWDGLDVHLVAGIWIYFSPIIWVVFVWDQRWREEKSLKNDAQDVEIGVETVPDGGPE